MRSSLRLVASTWRVVLAAMFATSMVGCGRSSRGDRSSAGSTTTAVTSASTTAATTASGGISLDEARARGLVNTDYAVDVGTPEVRPVQPGTRVELPFSVRNKGTKPDTYTVRTTSSRGWAEPANGAPVTLDPGATTTIVVVLQIPASAQRGDRDVVSLDVVSRSDPVVEIAKDVTVEVA